MGERVVHAKRGPGVVTEIMRDGRTVIRFDAVEAGVHRYNPSSMHKVRREDTTSTSPGASGPQLKKSVPRDKSVQKFVVSVQLTKSLDWPPWGSDQQIIAAMHELLDAL